MTENEFHTSNHSRDIVFSGKKIFFLYFPTQSVWSRGFRVITEDLEYYQTENLGLEVKYHNNSSFRIFSGKSNGNLKKCM